MATATSTTVKDKPESSTGGASETGEVASEELGSMIDELLNDVSNKFSAIASELTAKMDDMSRRIDNLEASMQQSQRDKDAQRSP